MDSARAEGGIIIEVARNAAVDGWLLFGPGEVVCGMLWDGTTLSEPPAPEPVVTTPLDVPMWKIMRVLILRGEDETLQTYLDSIPGAQGKVIRSDFARAPNLVVESPFADAAKAAMGWSDADYLERIFQADAITG